MANIFPNPSFETDISGVLSSQCILSHQTGVGQDGTGFLRGQANGTGNRNINHLPIACNAGDMFSTGAWVRWANGTPRAMTIMVRFLDINNVQTGNFIGGAVTPGTLNWVQITSLGAVAPANTTKVQTQIRINAAGSAAETCDIDLVQLNAGATLDPTDVSYTASVIVGGSEVPVTSLAVVSGGSEVPVSIDSVIGQ